MVTTLRRPTRRVSPGEMLSGLAWRLGIFGAALIAATTPATIASSQEDSETQRERGPTFIAIACSFMHEPQDEAPNEGGANDNRQNEVADLKQRVEQLEERVATLERLLLSRIVDATPTNREQLQSELQLARERFDHTKRLFDKGYISKLELMSAEYSVERAELRLELATMAADEAEFSASMQLFEAQANLDLALQRLETSSHLAARGFITQTQLRSDQLDADRARRTVESMRERLRANDRDDADDDEGNVDRGNANGNDSGDDNQRGDNQRGDNQRGDNQRGDNQDPENQNADPSDRAGADR